MKISDIFTFFMLSFLSFGLINSFAFPRVTDFFDFNSIDCDIWQYEDGGIDIITSIFILIPLSPFYIACFYKSYSLFKNNKIRSISYFIFASTFILYWFYTYYARFMFYC